MKRGTNQQSLPVTRLKYDLNPRGQTDISDGRLQLGDEVVPLLPPDVRFRHEGSPQVYPRQLRERLDGVEEVQAPELAPGHAEVGELREELGEVEAVVYVLANPTQDIC